MTSRDERGKVMKRILVIGKHRDFVHEIEQRKLRGEPTEHFVFISDPHHMFGYRDTEVEFWHGATELKDYEEFKRQAEFVRLK